MWWTTTIVAGLPCGVLASGQYPPAGQDRGSEVPKPQADPAGHALGASAPEVQNVCAGHAVGAWAPAGQYVPDGQVFAPKKLGVGKAGKPVAGAIGGGEHEAKG